MKILLIHQNFPGQFRQLVPYLKSLDHDLMCICSHDRPLPPLVSGWRYKEPADPPIPMSLGQQLWWQGIYRAESVAHICAQLAERSWVPDIILAHSGWGETLGIREVWPDVPQIIWPEMWMLPHHAGYGLDPTLPEPNIKQHIEQLGRNTMTAAALHNASAWVLPTKHQADSLPQEFQSKKLNVIHEGIDTNIAIPNPDVNYVVRGININRQTPTITFVNRNLERLRGFDTFMNSLPKLLKEWPELRIIIVGDSGHGYGNPHPSGRPIREVLVEELSPKMDFERVHFLGRIPYSQLLAVLQASWVHVYLSYPFVLGWSLLEAMSCGCAVVGSRGMPVEEVISDGVNGLLVDMDDPDQLAAKVSLLLRDESLRDTLGINARTFALKYDQSKTHPMFLGLIQTLTNDDQSFLSI